MRRSERDDDGDGNSGGDGTNNGYDDNGTGDDGGNGVVICNPASGSADHAERVVSLARDHGLSVRLTEDAGDTERFARAAANDGAGLVIAAGGDGTVNEVVDGLVDANALDRTTLGVVPAGTGNNFASNLGIGSVEDAFEILETGRRRRIDLGIANGRAFVNSCVGGVTAEASGETGSEEKQTWGVLAYVENTLETVSSFESLPLRATLENGDGSESDAETKSTTDPNGRVETWTGNAMFVLVGNCRRFTSARRAQANVEDGLFEVTIVEDASPVSLVSEATFGELFKRETTHIVQRRVPALTLESRHSGPIEYSLDGEMLAAETLELRTHPRTLDVLVGEGYRPNPDEGT